MDRKLYLTSKNFSTGVRVFGVLYENGGNYRFEYKLGGRLRGSACILREFPNLTKIYEGEVVREFIDKIIPIKTDSSYDIAMESAGKIWDKYQTFLFI